MPGARQKEKEQTIWADPLTNDAVLREIHAARDPRLSGVYERGHDLFAEGQPARGVYLMRGRAKISVSSAQGKLVVLRIAEPGDLLGVNSVLNGLPFDYSAQALDNCRVDFIPLTNFVDLLDSNPAVRSRVLQELSLELSKVVEQFRILLLSNSAKAKLVQLLLKWCDEVGEVVPQGIRVNRQFTHEEIAQMICVSRETVSRLLAELIKQRALSVAAGAITVHERAAMKYLATQ